MDNRNNSHYSQNGRYSYKRRGSYSRPKTRTSSTRDHVRPESLNSNMQNHHRISQNPYGILNPYKATNSYTAVQESLHTSNNEDRDYKDSYSERSENQYGQATQEFVFQAPSDRDIRADTHPHDLEVQFPDDNDGYDVVRRFLYRILTSSSWGISEKYPSAVRATVNDWYGTGYYLRLRYNNDDLKDICPATWMRNQSYRNLPEAIDRRLRDMVASCVIHEVGKHVERNRIRASRLSRPSSFTSLRRMSSMSCTWVDSPIHESSIPDPRDTGAGYWPTVAPTPLRPFSRPAITEAWNPYLKDNTHLCTPIIHNPVQKTPSQLFETFLNESARHPVIINYDPSPHKSSIRKRAWKSLRGLLVEENRELYCEPEAFRTVRFEDTVARRSPIRGCIPAAQYNGSTISLHLDPSTTNTFGSTFSHTTGRPWKLKRSEKQNRNLRKVRISSPIDDQLMHSSAAMESQRSTQDATDPNGARNKRSTWYNGSFMQQISGYDDSASSCNGLRPVSVGNGMNTTRQQTTSLGLQASTDMEVDNTSAHINTDDKNRDTVMTYRENKLTFKRASLNPNTGFCSPTRTLPQEPLQSIQSSMSQHIHHSETPINANSNVTVPEIEGSDEISPIPEDIFHKDSVQFVTDTTDDSEDKLKNKEQIVRPSFPKPMKKQKTWGKKIITAITPANFR